MGSSDSGFTNFLKRTFTRYVVFQTMGWGFLVLINVFFAITYGKYNSRFIYRVMIFAFLGVFWSNVMRMFIRRQKVLLQPVQRQVIELFLITIIFGSFSGFCESRITVFFNLKSITEKQLSNVSLILSDIFYSFIYLFIWNCIYFIYHYIEKTRIQTTANLRLESRVKELELKSIQAELKVIKSHINPHFIFNALNSIRALVDENPARARKAITELSNILRSSMQAEKIEVVPFEREINIVKDYLELEHIRFEERLHISYRLDERTFERPVPPMLIQTLVENAIKHGISKNVEGGEINITSTIIDGFHMILIRNTGQLNGVDQSKGFGLISTESRLKLLFGNRARFDLKQIDGNVEAKVLIPIEASKVSFGNQVN
jgi:two-component system LytT family sensor kinase